MLDIKYAELHTALFLKGTNLGLKLNPHHRGGLILKYDREARELLVSFNGETAIIPTTNVASMVEGKQPDRKEEVKEPFVAKTAQVSSPMQHVFAGPGHGKSGKDK